MNSTILKQKEVRIYSILMSLIICGLATAVITAQKIVHIGISFPFATVAFSIFTYPLLDCICELWGKEVARKSALLSSGCQVFIALIIQISILVPGGPT